MSTDFTTPLRRRRPIRSILRAHAWLADLVASLDVPAGERRDQLVATDRTALHRTSLIERLSRSVPDRLSIIGRLSVGVGGAASERC